MNNSEVIKRILAELPESYAVVSCQHESLSSDLKTGIVIPSYCRGRYLRRCLESLCDSDLSETAICIIDETDASRDAVRVLGFTRLYDVDFPGFDIGRVYGSPEEVRRQAAADRGCVAFNEIGWTKYALCPIEDAQTISNGNFKFYVRDAVYHANPELRQFSIPADGQEQENRELIEEFCPAATVVRLFKNRHGNVHDSLEKGWDLLLALFNVDNLGNLDSDTIVKEGWLRELRSVYQRATRDHPGKPIIATSYNSNWHPVSEKRETYLQKYSLGGVNFLFSREVYRNVVRPNLKCISWDWDVVNAVREQSGLLVCTPRSFVQHIGAIGMGSRPLRFDRALDF